MNSCFHLQSDELCVTCLFIPHLLTTDSFPSGFGFDRDVTLSWLVFFKLTYRKINYLCVGVDKLWSSLHTFIVVSVRKGPEGVCFIILFLIEKIQQS